MGMRNEVLEHILKPEYTLQFHVTTKKYAKSLLF